MPTGQHYSQETKELILNAIKFIEGEKNGAIIPLYNVNDRIMSALQISHGSLVNLKNELKELEGQKQKALEQKLLQEQQQRRPYVLAQKYKNECLRRRSSSPYTVPRNNQSRSMNVPRPAKRAGPTSLKVSLTEKAYIRDRNTSFTLTEVGKLAQEWIDDLDATEAISYTNHFKKCEMTFKKADMYVEEIEEKLDDDHDEDDYSVSGTDTDDDDE